MKKKQPPKKHPPISFQQQRNIYEGMTIIEKDNTKVLLDETRQIRIKSPKDKSA